ncbi:phage holin family protein [Rhizobium sp. BK379]|jgi:uncharacterized membrane protein|uniref:phage holin family protein n=1 Tax=Rhizobium sp. BK379 TaxID=2587059 RepID=UPI000DD81438|nr:phage holin family protein [Rhizobium sp. BK379]MBB3444163.1 putative membrane protein [Rhizobium sp. BK379]
MAKANENTPLSELIGGLLSDVTGLLRKEIDLAKTEVSEKVKKALSGVEFLMIGLVLAIGAVGVLLSALVSGLAVVLSRYGISEVSANALAAVIVGLVIGAIAWLLIARGVTALRGTELTLDRTTASLRRDAEIVKEKV